MPNVRRAIHPRTVRGALSHLWQRSHRPECYPCAPIIGAILCEPHNIDYGRMLVVTTTFVYDISIVPWAIGALSGEICTRLVTGKRSIARTGAYAPLSPIGCRPSATLQGSPAPVWAHCPFCLAFYRCGCIQPYATFGRTSLSAKFGLLVPWMPTSRI